MAKQLNKVGVSLEFTANTKQAERDLKSLQDMLTNLSRNAGNNSQLGLTKDIKEAVTSVTKLQVALKNATSETGKLDLGQFSMELKKGGLEVDKLAQHMSNLGPEGQAAFAQIAQSITTAAVPIRRTNSMLKEFATTLANTARWQISSSILHGFMGSLQTAVYYAQDLNESLNNIRIVTGKSTDEMSKFAKQANEAAKALSTSTTEYSDAALIFYQQGLDDEEVLGRTDTVIKMANVTRDSAEEVSSYMTAIWNNFDDGSESLEHYADVITALGAATASSSAEIASGLEQFAAIGQTVGLSYDYATTALATVVAQTRQSESVVGNAFKTIFSRFQGLSLGETLDDDTTLNKYSKALASVGVNIKDQSGELKKMDNILNELGDKWGSLAQDQKMALAQTVGGARQYTQLMALMDNWGEFQKNLIIAQNSDGSLQAQADIYAESWEAARDRVTAAAEEIYSQLLNDEFFIDLTDGFAKVLDGISNLIDGLGGLQGVLPLISTMLLKAWGPELAKAIDDRIFNIQNFSKAGKESLAHLKDQFTKLQQEMIGGGGTTSSVQVKMIHEQGALQEKLLLKQQELEQVGSRISQDEQSRLSAMLDLSKAYADINIKQAEELELEEKQYEVIKNQLDTKLRLNGAETDKRKSFGTQLDSAKEDALLASVIQDVAENLNSIKTEKFQVIYDYAVKIRQQLGEEQSINVDFLNDFIKRLEESNEDVEQIEEALKEMQDAAIEAGDKATASFQELIEFLENTGIEAKDAKNMIAQVIEESNAMGSGHVNLARTSADVIQVNEELEEVIDNLGNSIASTGEKIVELSQGASNLAIGISSLSNIPRIFSNEDLSTGEKLLQLVTSLGMGLPMLIGGIQKINNTLNITTGIREGLIKIAKSMTVVQSTENALLTVQGHKNKEIISQTLAEISAKRLDITTMAEQNDIKGIQQLLDAYNIKISNNKIKLLIKETLARKAHNETLREQIALEKTLKILKGVGIGLAVGITAATVAIAAYNKHVQKQIELNKETISQQKEYRQELEGNKELYNSYNDLFNQYKQGLIQKEQLYDATDKICEAYGLESSYVSKLTGDYNALAESAKKARLGELQKISRSAEQQKDAASSLVESDARGTKGYKNLFTGTYELSFDNGNLLENDIISKELAKFGKVSDNREVNFFANTPEEIVQLYDDLSQAYENAYDKMDKKDRQESSELKDVKQWIDDMKESVDAYKESIDVLNQTKIETDFINGDITNSENYSEFENKVNQLFENYKDNEGLTQALEDYIGDWGGEYGELYLGLKELSQQVDSQAAEYINELSDKDKKFILSGEVDLRFVRTKEDIQKEIQLAYQDIFETFSLGDGVGFGKALAGGKKLTKADNENLASLENSNPELMAGFDNKSTMSQFDTIDRITKYKIEKNKEYLKNTEEVTKKEKEVREQELKDWETTYNNLSVAKDNLGVLSDEDEATYQEAEKQIKLLKEEVLGLQSVLDNGLSWEEINELSFDTIISEMEMVTSKADLVSRAMSLIGDGFKVAASDVESLAETFPALLENAQALSDGTLQLDKDTVNNNLELVKQEFEERQKLKIAEIDQQIALKEAEQEFLKEKLDALNSYLTGTKTEVEAEGQIQAAAQKYRSQLLEITGQDIAELTNFAITQSSTEGEALVKMINQVGSGFAQAAKAHAAMINGDANFNWNDVGFSGSGGGAESFALSSGQTAIDRFNESSEQYQRIFDEAQNTAAQLETVTGEIDRLNGQKAIIESSLNNAINSLENVQSGKAGKQSKSGSGGSKNKDKDEKKYEEEFDRYHDLTEAIKDLEDAMSDLDKQQQHLYGKELARSLREENGLLEQQKANYEALLEAQRAEMAEVQGSLAAYGAQFDSSSGRIVNYAEITLKALQDYNAAIAAFNASAQTEADKLALQQAEKTYETIKKLISTYDGLVNKIRSTENSLEDLYFKELENNLKAWEAEIQVDLDLKEANRTWKKFVNDITDDFKSIYRNVGKDMASMVEQAKTYVLDGGTIETDLRAVKDIEREIDKLMAGGKSDKFFSVSEAQEELKKFNDQLQQDAEDLYKLYEDAWDGYIEGIEQAIDKFDDLLKRYDKINDDLDHQGKMIELLYGDEAYEYLTQLYDAQAGNLLGQMSSLNTQIQFYKSQYEHAAAEYGADSEAAQKWKESWEDAVDELHDKEEEYLETLAKDYANAITKAFSEIELTLGNGQKFNFRKEQWDLEKSAADGYYDSIQKIYQLESLESKWQAALTKNSTLKNQQKLKDLMDSQLADLKDKTKLTEYDIELAQKRLEVAQAEIALEEAQNSKTDMKLTRDESGNWTYQYIANQDDVANKQQAVLDAVYQTYELATQRVSDLDEQIMNATADWMDKIEEIQLQMQDATEEERERMQEQIDWYNDYYYALLQDLNEERNTAVRDAQTETTALLLEEYTIDTENYNQMTEDQKALLDAAKEYNLLSATDLYTQLSNLYQMQNADANQMYNDIMKAADDTCNTTLAYWNNEAEQVIKTWVSNPNSVMNEIQKAMDNSVAAQERYDEAVHKGCAAAGEDFANVGYMIYQDVIATQTLQGQTEALVGETCALLAQYEQYLADVAALWRAVEQEILNATALIQQYLALQGVAASISKPSGGSVGSGSVGKSPITTGSSGGNSGKNSGGNGTQYIITGTSDNSHGGTDVPTYTLRPVDSSGKTDYSGSYISKTWDEIKKMSNVLNPQRYATGGYTGDWGSEGRLAILDQKELILNAKDTENMLSAVNTIREISSLGNSISNSIANSIASMIAKMMIGSSSPQFNNSTSSTEQQNVFNINAEFPNANDVDSIRDAILSLPNLANQYLARR